MNAINAVQLFIMVWTFTAVCQADVDFCSVTCQNVTGSVGKEATFTCNISKQCAKCCVVMYKFQYPESYKDSTIHKEVFPVNSCEQRNSFTCRYTPPTAMTEKCSFFVQTKCGVKRTLFTVDVNLNTATIKPEIITEVVTPGKTEKPPWDGSETSLQKKAEGNGFKIAVIAAVISGLIIIIMPIIYRMTQKHPKQKRTFLIFRHDEDNSNHPENVI